MSEFKRGDIVQVRLNGGDPERYVLTSDSTGACEWFTAYNIDTGVMGMVQLLRGSGTTVRKLKKSEGLLFEVRTAMTIHYDRFCERQNYITSLL